MMFKFFDFNIHPNIDFLQNNELKRQIISELNCTEEDLIIAFSNFYKELSIEIKAYEDEVHSQGGYTIKDLIETHKKKYGPEEKGKTK
mgnify:CR=1 FL=1